MYRTLLLLKQLFLIKVVNNRFIEPESKVVINIAAQEEVHKNFKTGDIIFL